MRIKKLLISKIKPVIKAMRLEEQSILIVSYLYGWLDSHTFVKQQINRLVSSGIGLILISIVSFLVNEYIDAKDTDQYREDKNDETPPASTFLAAIILCVFFGLIIAWRQGFLWQGVVLVMAGIIYSLPPIRTKNRPFWDFFTLALLFVVIPYLLPYWWQGNFLNFSWLSLGFLLLFALTSNLIAVVRDIEPDQKAKLTTTGTVLGYKRTLILGAIMMIASLIMAGVMLYQRIGWWYYPTFLFALAVLCIVSFCAGSRFKPQRVAHYCRQAIKVGVKITYLVIVYQLATLAVLG